MKVFYDNQTDALYLELADERPEGVMEISEGVHLDVTHGGKLVGIEIIDASERMDIKTILSYSLELDRDMLTHKAA